MIFEFILYTFSSLLIIYSIHNLYNYLKNTYTTKKTKDLVVFHLNKYQDILETVKTKRNERCVSSNEIDLDEKIRTLYQNTEDTQDDSDEIEFISNNEKDILQNSLLNLIKDNME